jgi:hypothetical protein
MRYEDHGAFKILQGMHQHFFSRKIHVIGRTGGSHNAVFVVWGSSDFDAMTSPTQATPGLNGPPVHPNGSRRLLDCWANFLVG